MLGVAIKKCIDEGLVKREELFITSKLWMSDCHPETVETALQRSLKLLQLDYLDLYLIHWPVIYTLKKPRDRTDLDNWFVKSVTEQEMTGYDADTFAEVWKEMEKLVYAGRIKSIGVANFSKIKLMKLMETAKIKPANIQMEIHPYNGQYEYVEYLKSLGIRITAYQSLGGGEDKIGEHEPLLQNKVINDIAKKHNRSCAQVLLRWAIQRGLHIIPRSSNPEHVKSNIEIFDFELDKEDLEHIESLDTHDRICIGYFCQPKGTDVRKVIWDE